jgi:type I restriction enzyme S subunit
MEKQLPKNWAETSPLEISKIIRGVSYGKTDASQFEFENSCLILRGGNIQDGNIVNGKDNVYVPLNLINDEQFIQEYDVVIVGSTGSKNLIGKAATALFESDKTSFGAFLMNLRALHPIDKKYFSYYFQTNYYREAIRNLAGGVNINNIRKEYIENLYFPLPPLAEQNRIVAKLDTLFAQQETIKTSMEKIPVLLKNFRQQVLTQAVTGKLTESWRVGKELEETQEMKVGNFMKEVKDKIDPTQIDEVPYIGLEHIQKDRGIIETGISINLKSNKTVFKKGDVIYGKLRPYLNKHDVVDFDGICSTDILVYRNCNINSSKFFNYFLGNPSTIEKLNSEAKGINLPRVSAIIVNNLMIKVPSVKEQQEIVSQVESLFAKADAIEKQYETLKQKIDTLPQAILHKAFKGELTEQLDSDGDARELLQQIQELKTTAGKTGKKVGKKVKTYEKE